MRIFHHSVKWSSIVLIVLAGMWAYLSFAVNWQKVAQQQLDMLSQDKPLQLSLEGTPSFSFPLAMRLPTLTLQAKNSSPLLPHITLQNIRVSFSLKRLFTGRFEAASVQAEQVLFASNNTEAMLENFSASLAPDTTDVIAVNGQYNWNAQEYTFALRTRFMDTTNAATFAVQLAEKNNPAALLQLAGLGVVQENIIAVKFDTITLESTTMAGQLVFRPEPTPSIEGKFHAKKVAGGQSFFKGQDFAVLSGFMGNGGSNGTIAVTIEELNIQNIPLYTAQLNATFTPEAPIRLNLQAVTATNAPLTAAALFTHSKTQWSLEQITLQTTANTLNGQIDYLATPEPRYVITLNTPQYTSEASNPPPLNLATLDAIRALKTPISLSFSAERFNTFSNAHLSIDLTGRAITLHALKADVAPQQSFSATGSMDIAGLVPNINLKIDASSTALKQISNIFGAPPALLGFIKGQTTTTLNGYATNLALNYTQQTPQERLAIEGAITPHPTLTFKGNSRYQAQNSQAPINAVSPLLVNATGLELSQIQGTLGQAQISGYARLATSTPPTLDFRLESNNLPGGFLFLPFFALPAETGDARVTCNSSNPLNPENGFNFSGFASLNGQIQLKTQQTTFQNNTFYNATAAYTLQNGRLTGRLAAQQQNGNAQIDLAAYTNAGLPTLETRFTLNNMSTAMFLTMGNSGTISATGVTSSLGKCVENHQNSLQGNAQVQIQNIFLPLPNLASAAQILRNTPNYIGLIAAKNSLEPQTFISNARSDLRFNQGLATLQNTTLAFDGGGLRVEGVLNVPRRLMRLATFVSFDVMPQNTPPLKFTVDGSFDNPQVNFSLF